MDKVLAVIGAEPTSVLEVQKMAGVQDLELISALGELIRTGQVVAVDFEGESCVMAAQNPGRATHDRG